MPTVTFALNRGGPKNLALELTLTEVIVKLDGEEQTRFTPQQLQAGHTFTLKDGTTLRAQRKLIPAELTVERDGVRLEGGGPDPDSILEQVWKQTTGWAVVFVLWAGYSLKESTTFSLAAGAALGMAAALGAMAYLAKKRWLPSIGITALLFTAYLAWFAAERSVCTALPFVIFPLWYAWAWRVVSRSAPRGALSSTP
ncbi:MAG: hypothetical protein JNK82_26375 [Myxococcaceae bacterium]|nr:hypothetical protein [Myxococcaceae bacterium]